MRSYPATNNHAPEFPQPAGLPLWKSAFDVVVLLATLPVWLPLAILVAVVIRLGSPGPILFRQKRVGQGGRLFTCFKFRTMQIHADQGAHRHHVKDLIRDHVPMVKLDAGNDGRLTRGGSWIRASGLDELPQILNILRGEMSVVGPRPCIPYEYELYEPWQRYRFEATPGLTGLWQVTGKNRTTFDEMVRMDIDYAQRRSLWLDLWILFRTPLAILQQVRDLLAAKRARRGAASVARGAAGAPNTKELSS
jgi:lipopolysaccharide/colanic/teichoic acid biosynthesis glycosyltransferase